MPRSLSAAVALLLLTGCLPAGMAPAGGFGPDAAAEPGFRLQAAGDQALVLDRAGRLWEWGMHPLWTAAAPREPRVKPGPVALLARVAGMAASDEAPGLGSTAHTLAVRDDGTVWAWGDNDLGQAGHGGAASDRPAQVPGLTGVAFVEAGWKFSLALKADGTVWAWGHNAAGQLGDGGVVGRGTPAPVAGLKDVTLVRAGRRHALALGRDGRVWAWGANDFGQLGLPPHPAPTRHADLWVATPAAVPGLVGVVEVAAAEDYALARLADGTLRAWGHGVHGTLGVPRQAATRGAPPAPVPGVAGATALAAGRSHALALLADGRVLSWGSNDLGELGRGTAAFGAADPTPQAVEGLTGVVAIAAGRHFSLAIDRDAQVWAWGSNTAGQDGQGPAGPRGGTQPVRVLAPAGDGSWKVDQ